MHRRAYIPIPPHFTTPFLDMFPPFRTFGFPSTANHNHRAMKNVQAMATFTRYFSNIMSDTTIQMSLQLDCIAYIAGQEYVAQ